jgi:hypothetical protein
MVEGIGLEQRVAVQEESNLGFPPSARVKRAAELDVEVGDAVFLDDLGLRVQ